ncbi:cap-specific mRNA (nucleoside-2'-O-)-methyltransferase [Acrasis kona]|uniref:Cap-specific mRNA (nucleoside-2'-O-)-methyltransferase n=1 Tax=Acrasis kona TaxID=1008807 RepID=A0AAW2ZFU6_9EUKA
MSEIEFLVNYSDACDTVVYAGAAPGTHINFLSTLFPHLSFILVDPRDFHTKSSDKITIVQEYFTDEMALKYRGQGVLFISDIRTSNWQIMSNEKVEESVNKDQDDQMRWHNIMVPHRSMLKFRLPYVTSYQSKKYLSGKVYLPVWGPASTTETRLVPDACPSNAIMEARSKKMTLEDINNKDFVNQCNTKVWDCLKYQDQMFYFNNVTRVTFYHHDVEADGIDHCYDCNAEIFILYNYLVWSGDVDDNTPDEEVAWLLSDFSESVSAGCSNSGRLLSHPMPVRWGDQDTKPNNEDEQ